MKCVLYISSGTGNPQDPPGGSESVSVRIIVGLIRALKLIICLSVSVSYIWNFNFLKNILHDSVHLLH